jgi:hypothetical protein
MVRITRDEICSVQKSNWAGMVPNSIIIMQQPPTDDLLLLDAFASPPNPIQHFFTAIDKRDAKFNLLSSWLKYARE